MITFSKIGSLGRLGNQLFQISAAIGLANRNGDAARFKKWGYSQYFKTPIIQDLPDNINLSLFSEKDFHYSPIPYKENLDIIGYFQSEKYFYDCKDLIKSIFDFIDDLYDGSQIDYSSETCSIHIRRGDYLNLSEYHPFPGLDYYVKSMDHMRRTGVNKFYMFSDDIDWCKESFKNFSDVNYIEGNSDIKDMCLMSSCKNNIIANSSFSWWGAWLNKNQNKKIISPSNWFGPAKKNVITRDVYCEGWIII